VPIDRPPGPGATPCDGGADDTGAVDALPGTADDGWLPGGEDAVPVDPVVLGPLPEDPGGELGPPPVVLPVVPELPVPGPCEPLLGLPTEGGGGGYGGAAVAVLPTVASTPASKNITPATNSPRTRARRAGPPRAQWRAGPTWAGMVRMVRRPFRNKCTSVLWHVHAVFLFRLA
jgi:hypothetical protein